MHISPLTMVAGLTLICPIAALFTIRPRHGSSMTFNAGTLLALAVSAACATPLLSQLSWAELVDEAGEQALAALQLLHAAYVILTL